MEQNDWAINSVCNEERLLTCQEVLFAIECASILCLVKCAFQVERRCEHFDSIQALRNEILIQHCSFVESSTDFSSYKYAIILL